MTNNEITLACGTEDGLAGAVLSCDGRYRFELTRSLARHVYSHKAIMWLMNNPSTADHEVDDPTIKRCKSFTAMWGCTRLVVGNVNPHRSTDPKLTERPSIDTLAINDKHLLSMAEEALVIICAWGAAADPALVVRAWRLLDEAYPRKMCALGLTKGGSPKHPLYIKATTKPVRIQAKADADQWRKVDGLEGFDDIVAALEPNHA